MFFFFKQKTAYEMLRSLVGSEMCIRDRGKGTDCYPRKHIKTMISLETINEAILMNPRNAYQNYLSLIHI